MTHDDARLARIDAYIEDLFTPQDDALRETLRAAEAAGLPSINVSANQGKLLYLLTRIAGARRVLEIGTLGGYSTTWLARALAPGGRLVTLELEPMRAELARRSLARSVPGVDIDVKVGPAADTLLAMIVAGEPPFDLVFIDADKPGYVEYLTLALRLSRPGTVILADNVIRNGLVLDPPADDANAVAARDFNAVVAAHPRLESLVLPLMREYVDGLSISIVTA
jgi:predicted O-methyltransferase YrrM